MNRRKYQTTWTDVTSWSIDVELVPGQNSLEFEGYDSSSEELAGMNDSISVTYTGQ